MALSLLHCLSPSLHLAVFPFLLTFLWCSLRRQFSPYELLLSDAGRLTLLLPEQSYCGYVGEGSLLSRWCLFIYFEPDGLLSVEQQLQLKNYRVLQVFCDAVDKKSYCRLARVINLGPYR